MNERCKSYRLLILIFLIISEGTLNSQQSDYRKIFGSDWDKAENFITANETWMKTACEEFKISYPFAIAIIFPELIRYSALQDKIEISLLKTLYVNLGEEYADFSVGPFQMKPSFAEKIIEKSKTARDRKIRNSFTRILSIKDITAYRAAIVTDLEDPEKEFIYLGALIRICELTFGKEWADDSEKLRFFASAYNCGFDKSREYIEEMSEKKFFGTSLVKKKLYSYSDVSLYWYTLNRNRR